MVTIEKQVKYWQNSAERNWATAQDLFKTKHYDACLFFCHLTLEKILKAIVTRVIQESVPYTHDLEKLARLANLKLTIRQLQDLKTITTFNITARYDEIKLAFYKRCTFAFTQKYLKISEKLYLWFKKEFQNKQ